MVFISPLTQLLSIALNVLHTFKPAEWIRQVFYSFRLS